MNDGKKECLENFIFVKCLDQDLPRGDVSYLKWKVQKPFVVPTLLNVEFCFMLECPYMTTSLKNLPTGHYLFPFNTSHDLMYSPFGMNHT